jgi:hypothetical protein
MWWTAYFILLAFLDLHLYQHILIDLDISNSYKGLFFSSIQILGLVGFITNKKFISKIFWNFFYLLT